MLRDALRTLRYGQSWITQQAPVEELEITIDRDGEPIPGTLYLPAKGRGRVPSWIILHGITRPGRAHPMLQRFARAVAATRAAVLVPEIPEWRELSLTSENTVPTIRAAAVALTQRPEVSPGGTVLVGFSFGAPQAIIASTHDSLNGLVAGVVGFGGYFDLGRTIRFQLTGQHEFQGTTRTLEPDPYGRWVVGTNLITRTRRWADADDVATVLWELATVAGEHRVMAWDPVYDPLKVELRKRVRPEHRELFDAFAPPSGTHPHRELTEAVADELIQATVKETNPLDPGPFLEKVSVPVRLIHGREDRLIPFTEMLRLTDAFPEKADVEGTITGLFAHSVESDRPSLSVRAREGVRLFEALRGVFGLV